MTAHTGERPTGVLGKAVESVISAVGKRAVSSVSDRMGSATERLADYTKGAAGDVKEAVLDNSGPAGKALGLVDKVKQKLGGGGGGGGKLKVTNIVESIDVAVPLSVAYNQWTQFTDFPSFMKKVQAVEQGDEPQKLSWKAQILWSHRSWESDIVDQVPDQRIVWRSQGAKGYPDGAVTFHELGPNLTRIVLVLEYHPQGFFEYTGNLWRAQGRRARLELKHFARHVMTDTLLHPQDVTGWRGEIHDGEVTAEPGEAEADTERDAEGGTEAESGDRDEPRDESRGDRGDSRGDRGDRADRADRGDSRGDRGESHDDREKPRGERRGRAKAEARS